MEINWDCQLLKEYLSDDCPLKFWKNQMIYIGTSGWVYSGWREKFYPLDLPSKDYLSYYGHHFNTTEINYSFYHLPKPETYKKWSESVKEDFIFAVKASRFITHIKRLKDVKTAWNKFVDNARILQNKLHVILLQFPPSFKKDLKRLEVFLKYAVKSKVRLALEFRHKSWFEADAYKLFKKYNAALVIADSGSRYPTELVRTADFLYLRFHGPKELFASKYSDDELKDWAGKIKKNAGRRDIYIYFNNDFFGYAIENANSLKKLFRK